MFSIINIVFLVVLAVGCDSTSFEGQSVQRYGSVGGEELNYENPEGPNGTGESEKLGPDGKLIEGGGETALVFNPLTIQIMRRDSGSGHHGHGDVAINYEVEGRAQIKGNSTQGKGGTKELGDACLQGGPTSLVISFSYGGTTVRPHTNTYSGGPIGHRLSEHAILVGFEKEAVNNGGQTAYHNNDDLVVLLACPEGSQLSVKDLCIDTRIPGTTAANSDLTTDKITYSGDSLGRECKGT